MAQDIVVNAVALRQTRHCVEVLNSEMMPDREFQKDRGKRMLKTVLNRLRLRRCASVEISRPDPTYKVAYLGNVVTGWAKGDGCVEKPLATLWRNYTQSSRSDVRMQLTVSGGGLKATTRDHGLTEYWAHRLTCCAAPSHFPRIFCWVYRHEGRRLRHELRCHAVLCTSASAAKKLETELKHSLALALSEFKRDKISRQNARLSLVNSLYENPTMPRRKILLSTGTHNYKPPLERSKSAPKLVSIEENVEEEEEEKCYTPRNVKMLKHYDSTGALLDKRKELVLKLNKTCRVPADQPNCDRPSRTEVTLSVDERSDLILEQLLEDSLKNDLIESCVEQFERNWFGNLGETPDLIPLDSDESSLSSGCESASTVTSDLDQAMFAAAKENEDEENHTKKKTELDFKVGGCVISRVKSLERITNTDLIKYCGLRSGVSIDALNTDQVSLIPVGESDPSDFSSLKVFKKRSHSDSGPDLYSYEGKDSAEQETAHGAIDEGYDDMIDCASSVSNVISV